MGNRALMGQFRTNYRISGKLRKSIGNCPDNSLETAELAGSPGRKLRQSMKQFPLAAMRWSRHKPRKCRKSQSSSTIPENLESGPAAEHATHMPNTRPGRCLPAGDLRINIKQHLCPHNVLRQLLERNRIHSTRTRPLLADTGPILEAPAQRWVNISPSSTIIGQCGRRSTRIPQKWATIGHDFPDLGPFGSISPQSQAQNLAGGQMLRKS